MNPAQARHEALVAEGWQREFVVEAGRVDEYVELYQSVGKEVRVEPVLPEDMTLPECADCALVLCREYKIIYTRRQMADGVVK